MKIKYLLYLIVLFFMASFHSYGHDVTVQINGTVTDQTCNVVNDDKIKNVVFDDLEVKSFKSTGSTSVAKPLTITLENCTNSISSLKYQFTGDADGEDANLLAIKNNSTTAADGLAVQIMNKELTQQLNLNQVYSITDYIKGGCAYVFNFALRYKSTKDTITVGDASSILYLDFYYE